MEQKHNNALPRDDKPGLRAGNLIYTRVVLPNTEFENGRRSSPSNRCAVTGGSPPTLSPAIRSGRGTPRPLL